MALIAPPIQAADIGNGGLGALGLYFQRRDQSILGPDHQPITFAFDTNSDRELRLHADAPFAAHAEIRGSSLAKEVLARTGLKLGNERLA